MRSSESSVPRVGTAGVNECPAPATRTSAERTTAAATSARPAGRSNAAGAHVCVRDQFVHISRRLRCALMADHAFHADDVDVTPAQVREQRDGGELQLIDVREPYEWEAGRIAGARHIELERVASQADTIDRDRPVVFYCRLGARSGMAANAFRRAGYDAYSLDGGITAWDAQDLGLEPDDGHVADH